MRGAGEIIITSISYEGTFKGLDLELIKFVSSLTSLPITYSGGFGKVNDEDRHPGFTDDIFSVNEEKITKNIIKTARGQKMNLIKGFYQDTIKNKKPNDLNIKKKARVVMIDCDLKESTKLALDFIKPSIQQGTIILFDDFLDYKGDINKGEYGAFKEFQESNPTILFRRAFDYGYRGRAFIAHKI